MPQPVLAIGLKGLRRRHQNTLVVTAEGNGQGSRGLLQPDAQGVFVYRLDLLDILIVWPDPRFDLWIDDAVNIPLGGRRVEVRTVVESHPFMQVEDIRPAL